MSNNQLTSYERTLLAHFITQTKDAQQEILRDAELDPLVPGPLLRAYREVLKLI